MSVYRQIQTTYWQDKFILTLTPEEKFFYIYLLTNSKTKQCGIYELPIKIIELETGYNRETVIKLLNKFIEYERIKYDWDFEEIAIKNWIKHNNYETNPKIQKCVEKELKEVKNETFIEFMEYSDTLYIGYHNKNKNKKNNKNKKDITAEAILIPLSEHALQKFIKNNCPNISKLKEQLTFEEATRLFTDFTEQELQKVIEAMENYKPLTTKSISVNLTIRNWIRRDRQNGTNQKSSTRGSIDFNKWEREIKIAKGEGATMVSGAV